MKLTNWSEGSSIIEFINIGINMKSDILTCEEKLELLDLVNNRFDSRLCMIDNGDNNWDFSISPMIIINGCKPAYC